MTAILDMLLVACQEVAEGLPITLGCFILLLLVQPKRTTRDK
jgi:hypothetical protein